MAEQSGTDGAERMVGCDWHRLGVEHAAAVDATCEAIRAWEESRDSEPGAGYERLTVIRSWEDGGVQYAQRCDGVVYAWMGQEWVVAPTHSLLPTKPVPGCAPPCCAFSATGT